MNKLSKIPFASIQVTSKCNLNCGFCFRRLNIVEVGTEKLCKTVSQLKEIGVETIILTGGEPLLRDDIVDIFKFIKKNNMKTVLQTNGLLLKEKLKELSPYLDWLSLSLDGDNSEIASKMRGNKHYFQNLMDLLEINNDIYKIKVKVGTVVTKLNIKDIKNIGSILDGKVDTWKLYQFFARKECPSEKNKDIYSVSNSDFSLISDEIKSTYPNMNIAFHSVDDYNLGPCLLVDADGGTFVSKDNGDYFIGNIISDREKVLQKASELGVLSQIEKNFNKTYGLQQEKL